MTSPRNIVRIAGVVLAVVWTGGVVRSAAGPLTDGAAIVDAAALRELDSSQIGENPGFLVGFGLRRMLDADGTASAPLLNDEFFALPAMLPVRQAIDRDIDAYIALHRMERAGRPLGADDQNYLQVFDRDLLYSAGTRFALAGIVNRMDRAFVSPAGCGEIRLIYRLIRTEPRLEPARLPMTLNVVLAAANPAAAVTSHLVACGDIARRWLAMQHETRTGAALVRYLTGPTGPLALVEPSHILRIEMSLQVGHQPKTEKRPFRTDYLMKVFRYDRTLQRFDEVPLENQIDRDRLLGDASLKSEFAKWLLQPDHLRSFDRGTLLVPEKFLARAVVTSTPVGFVRSKLQPEFGLVQSPEVGGIAPFTARDIVDALKKAADSGVVLQNIRSVAGFERRLNDLTCAGCHQTRGIGAFHFPGVNWTSKANSSHVSVPASPHFVGDQPRRRDILKAFSEGRSPDFSRGFSSRPQLRGDTTLLGTEYYDGWGAHCYDGRGEASDNDRSFRAWTCTKGLVCQVISDSSRPERMGMCFVGSSAGGGGDERHRAGVEATQSPDREK